MGRSKEEAPKVSTFSLIPDFFMAGLRYEMQKQKPDAVKNHVKAQITAYNRKWVELSLKPVMMK